MFRDDPEVRVWDGDINAAIRELRKRVSNYRTFTTLKARRENATRAGRRRAKKAKAMQRLRKRMRQRERFEQSQSRFHSR